MEEFIITLRESLEAALIIGIIFSYLKKTGKSEFGRFVYIGIFLGILGSIIGAIGFHKLVGNFDGVAEQIFEGTTMIVGAILIVYLIVWMADKKEASAAIRDQVNTALDKNKGLGLMILVFVSILREGVETTLFLSAVVSNQNSISQMSAFMGIAGGLLIGYGVYLGLKGMNLKYLFSISSALLILFATGLFAHGVHEFQESGLIPIVVEHMWNTDNIINSESIIGEFLKSLFGYNANPSLMEVLVYWSALIMMVLLYNKNSSKTEAIKVKA